MPSAPKQEELTSSFRIQTGSNGNGGPATSRRPSAQDTPRNGNGNGNGAADIPLTAPAEAPTTLMDMDSKEPKMEGQG